MKIICIGDLHGKDVWKQVNINKYDKIIFVGDYVDSYTQTNMQIKNNLLDLLQLKKDYSKKIILLLGNHDIQYLHYPEFRCTGFRVEMQPSLTIFFKENRNLFRVAYQIKKYLFTHAGISNSWYERYVKIIKKYLKICGTEYNLANILNAISQTKDHQILYEVGPARGGPWGYCGGIVWADKNETQNNVILGYHQIVGHHPVSDITTTKQNKNTSITHIDVLDKQTKFYEFDIN